MPESTPSTELLERALLRERRARKRAEQLLELKSRELFESNQSLEQASVRLNKKVLQRTLALEAERKRAQDEAEFLTTTLDAISQGVSVFDSQLRLRNWNKNLSVILSLPPDLLREGQSLQELLLFCAERGDYGEGDPHTLMHERLTTLKQRRERGQYQEVSQRANGKHIAISSRVLRNGGIVTTYSDITEQKRTEHTLVAQKHALGEQVAQLQTLGRSLEEAHDMAQSANRAKSRFVAMISHDIRTPVNGLLGTLTLLEQTALDDEQQELLSLSLDSGEQLRGLLADLIELSQADAGAIRLESTRFDLPKFVDKVAATWRAAAVKKGLTFDTTISGDLPHVVVGDAGRVRQILENLLSNAVKYSTDGGIRLHVDRVGGRVRFRVEDTGYGIAQEDQRRLFDHFTRVGQSARGIRGFGLGLAITRHLVELMKGEISLESELGVGSCFTVELPLPEVRNERDEAEPVRWSERRLRNAAGEPPRVLVAEDLATNQLIAKAYLERMGAVVELADNGQEAIDAVAAKAYDVVLMDVDMPIVGGFEAIRRIRSMAGVRADLPIIMATAFADADTRLRCSFMDVQGFVEKPIQPHLLWEVVQCALTPTLDLDKPDEVQETGEGDGIDRTVLNEMLEGLAGEPAAGLMQMASRDMGQMLEAIEVATEDQQLAHVAHKLKSLGGSFGAVQVGELARQLDRACRRGDADPAAVAAMRKELLQEGRRALGALNRYREERSSLAAS
ncbi:MAG: ATP-binding protein [Pseudomonadota bacterium]